MTSSSSSVSSDESFSDYEIKDHPLIRDKKIEKKDWIKIGAIVVAVIGAIIAGIAVLSIMQMLPTDPFGSPVAKGLTLIAGATILAPAALVLFRRYFVNPPNENELDSELESIFCRS